ncbi:Panacea domain-containing protein [Anaeromicropila herbilytica]|uniref:Uncharacterized protein n=1 Tax=Anaeromicropila herbilytica TaxID=2785025 RepID=A0A7R7IBM7_9FIRM|nr:hypothetical protein [Anaeromicropila herbilytica]BCN29808.1 hypothetical protein bsdtb5_11030 [Anaeromicropila herbilytica]
MKDNEHLDARRPIISIEEIKSILSDFKIGKKPLAKLLGWGETTIIRYIEGDIPTIEYSDKLRAIYDNPYYYYDILLKNQENLTNVAFKKSKKAVIEKLMNSKIHIITQYIINQMKEEVTMGEIQTLLYYMQGFSLAFNNEPLFEDEYYVTANNIPYLNLYESLKLRGINYLEIEEDLLSDNDKVLINSVLNGFSWYGMKLLNSMTSYERSLLRISRDKENHKIIAKETIKIFFKDIIMNYNISSLNEIFRYSDEKFHEFRKREAISI